MDTFVWEQLDFQEVQRAVDDILNGSFQFRDTVLELISGERPFTLDGFLRAVLQQAGTDWRTEKYILVSILVLAITRPFVKKKLTVQKTETNSRALI